MYRTFKFCVSSLALPFMTPIEHVLVICLFWRLLYKCRWKLFFFCWVSFCKLLLKNRVEKKLHNRYKEYLVLSYLYTWQKQAATKTKLWSDFFYFIRYCKWS